MSPSGSHDEAATGPPERGSAVRAALPTDPTSNLSDSAVGGSGSRSPRAVSENEATVISQRPPIILGPHDPAARLAELGAQLEGRQLGQFALQRLVGGGGMGAVFRAIDITLNRDVAVKVLSRHQSSDEEMLKRFKNEAQSAARLDHENIARVFFVGEDQGLNYIVFEFIEGTNLRDLVAQKGPLPFEEAISYTLQVAEALAHASQRDVIHRDIKPSNVIVTPEGKAKIVDMGLARLHQVEQTHDLTASGVTLGTFDYISPEQARDPRIADVRSDLYSLGCSLYYMLTGEPPYPEGTVLQKLLAHQESDPPDPRERRADAPAELVRITRRLMAKDPNKRFQSAEELIAELLTAGEKLGIAPVHLPTVPRLGAGLRRPSNWEMHLPWVVPLTALALIVLALDRYWGRTEESGGALGAVRPGATSDAPLAPPRGSEPPAVAARDAATSAPAETLRDSSPSGAARSPAGAARQQAATEGRASGARNPGESSDQATAVNPSTLALAKPLDSLTLASALQRPEVRDLVVRLGKLLSPSESGATPAPGAVRPPASAGTRVLVVSGADEGENSFTELQEACKYARSGDVIELRYSGVRPERSLALESVNVTIRAGEGFSPVVSLRPEAVDIFNANAAMIRLFGGQLVLQGVGVEMIVPPQPGEWALFELQQSDLRLEKTSLTMRREAAIQAENSLATVIDVKPPASAGTMNMLTSGMDEPSLNISLLDCLVRGDATMIRAHELQPVSIHWNNGIFASRERLLALASHGVGRTGGVNSVELRNLTIAARGGLALLAYGDAMRFPIKTEIMARDSIFLNLGNGRGNTPLVEQLGSGDATWTQMLLSWQGDHNFYEEYDVFWRIGNSSLPSTPRQLTFDEWLRHWGTSREVLPQRDSVEWRRLPPVEKPYADHLPQDYALADRRDRANPALTGASQGGPVGAIVDRLPVPADDEAAKPSQLLLDRRTRTPTPRPPAG